jgi:hypothetical protein
MAEPRFWKEVWQMLENKIAQGSAEIGQAINSSADGYVPYGTGQSPLEVEGPATSYTDALRNAGQHGREVEHGIDR